MLNTLGVDFMLSHFTRYWWSFPPAGSISQSMTADNKLTQGFSVFRNIYNAGIDQKTSFDLHFWKIWMSMT